MKSLRGLRFLIDAAETVVNIPIAVLEERLSKEQRIKRKLKKTPLKRISELKAGDYVQLEGQALAHQKILRSPLSKKKCLGFQIQVARDESDGRNDNYLNEELLVNFYLSDGENKILIIPRGASLWLKKEDLGTSGLLNNADSNMSDFLKRHGYNTTSFGFNKSLYYYEGRIEEGQTIRLVGKVNVLKSRNGQSQTVISHVEKSTLYISNDGSLK